MSILEEYIGDLAIQSIIDNGLAWENLKYLKRVKQKRSQ